LPEILAWGWCISSVLIQSALCPRSFVNAPATATNENRSGQATRAAIADRFKLSHFAGAWQIGWLRQGDALVFRQRRRFAVLPLALHSLLMLCFSDGHGIK